MRGRFESSLCLCLCLSLFLSLFLSLSLSVPLARPQTWGSYILPRPIGPRRACRGHTLSGFMHLWTTNLPCGSRAVLRSDAAQARRLLKATTKNERKRQRRRDQATLHEADQTASTASAGKLRTASPTRPVSPYDIFQ